jgi:hypothetical protein
MKKLLLFSFLFVALTFSVFAQTTKTYQIKWAPNPVADSTKGWSVYLEQRTTNTGFVLVDNMDYATTIDGFYKADVLNTGQTTECVYEINLPLDGKFSVAGIIAYAKDGTKSPVGTSTITKISKRPGKPTNVRIELKP